MGKDLIKEGFRTKKVKVGKTTFTPTKDVPEEMNKLVIELNKVFNQSLCSKGNAVVRENHPVAVAAWILHSFCLIHPFSDGNGRTARLLASYTMKVLGMSAISYS